jgi:hypothetical protein
MQGVSETFPEPLFLWLQSELSRAEDMLRRTTVVFCKTWKPDIQLRMQQVPLKVRLRRIKYPHPHESANSILVFNENELQSGLLQEYWSWHPTIQRALR